METGYEDFFFQRVTILSQNSPGNMSYFIFEHYTKPLTGIKIRPKWNGWFLYGKRRIEPGSEYLPFEFDLEQSDAGETPISVGYVSSECLFSDELLEVLYRAGVDNLDVFPALLHNTMDEPNVVYKNYKAVVVMGSVACVDKKRSGQVDLSDSTGLVKGGVERMYIDEAKTQGLLMFRTVPGIGAVIVHERVKKAIEASGLKYFRFYSPSEWGGF